MMKKIKRVLSEIFPYGVDKIIFDYLIDSYLGEWKVRHKSMYSGKTLVELIEQVDKYNPKLNKIPYPACLLHANGYSLVRVAEICCSILGNWFRHYYYFTIKMDRFGCVNKHCKHFQNKEVITNTPDGDLISEHKTMAYANDEKNKDFCDGMREIYF